MFWGLVWQGHALVITDLGYEDNSSDLFDLGIIDGRNSIHVACNLDSHIRNTNELLENVFGQHISKTDLLQVFRVDVDVVCAQKHICCRDSSDSPICFRSEFLLLIIAQRCYNHLVTVNVGRLERVSLQLGNSCILVSDTVHLLLLHGGWRNIHTQDDVFYL